MVNIALPLHKEERLPGDPRWASHFPRIGAMIPDSNERTERCPNRRSRAANRNRSRSAASTGPITRMIDPAMPDRVTPATALYGPKGPRGPMPDYGRRDEAPKPEGRPSTRGVIMEKFGLVPRPGARRPTHALNQPRASPVKEK
jgi:hypothetical protein